MNNPTPFTQIQFKMVNVAFSHSMYREWQSSPVYVGSCWLRVPTKKETDKNRASQPCNNGISVEMWGVLFPLNKDALQKDEKRSKKFVMKAVAMIVTDVAERRYKTELKLERVKEEGRVTPQI